MMTDGMQLVQLLRTGPPMTREGMVRELDRGEVSEREKVYVLDMLVTHGIVFGDPAGKQERLRRRQDLVGPTGDEAAGIQSPHEAGC